MLDSGTTAKGRFRDGEQVLVADRQRAGHVRTPSYIRGRTVTVVSTFGPCPDAEARAYGRLSGPGKLICLVRIRQADLWPDYPVPADNLYLEIYEDWLDPV